MNIKDANIAICKMLGVDAAKARFVRLTLRVDAPPLVEVENYERDPVIGADRYELSPIGTADRLAALLALAHQYASECGDCAGTRVCPDDEPCTACADVWAVIDKAEGRCS